MREQSRLMRQKRQPRSSRLKPSARLSTAKRTRRRLRNNRTASQKLSLRKGGSYTWRRPSARLSTRFTAFRRSRRQEDRPRPLGRRPVTRELPPATLPPPAEREREGILH